MAVSIRLDPEIEQRLDQLVAQTGRAKSYYLRELIEGGLDDLEDFYLADATMECWWSDLACLAWAAFIGF